MNAMRSCAGLLVTLSLGAVCLGEPTDDALVLWLDAADADSLVIDQAGHVDRWNDKSTRGNQARQDDVEARPRLVPDALGGAPAVRFDGNDFLNLGRPESLNIKAGEPLTIAVVYKVGENHHGTFLAKGGGEAKQRAYQFYVAPGRQGAIAHGAMREHPRSTGAAAVGMLVCDGRRADVWLNGQTLFSFDANGSGRSDVDVLIGARRLNADNSGLFYLLTGDLAEIVVYRRALSSEELKRLGRYFQEKYALGETYLDADDVDGIVGRLAAADTTAKLKTIADGVVRVGDTAVAPLRAMSDDGPTGALLVAELLVAVARKNELSDDLAALAGELLAREDPFVRSLAEWAISMKVGAENNGQTARWSKLDGPDWFATWMDLPHWRLLEADWVRQAVTEGLHHDKAKLLASVDVMILRAQRMADDFRSTSGAQSLLELHAIRERLAGTGPDDLAPARALWLDGRRQLRTVVMANPAIDCHAVVFVRRSAPHTVRNITRSYSWKHKPGGDICVLSDLAAEEPAVENLLQGRLGPGYVWGLDLWWDADRVVFGYARQSNWPPSVDTADSTLEGRNVFTLRQEQEPLHLFEAALDGSSLTQLTDDPYWSDFEPTYTADGRVVFASDRCGRAAECGNDTYDHTNPNLYVLSADRREIRRWTDSKDIDRYPHSLDDGRIAYTHWEYQERHFMEVHALWTARPDGAMSDALFKHHMPAPCGLRDTRSIPASSKLVSIATGHHTFAYGPVVVIDPSGGMNRAAGIEIVTPGVVPQEGPMAGQPAAEGGVRDRGGLYQTPWALSEKCFLVSYAYARANCTAPAGVDSNGFALYVIDAYGNRELVYRDRLLSCAFPIPLAPRRRPPVVPDVQARAGQGGERSSADAFCYVPDVYDGMEGVARGTIKYLRVAQHVGWPFDEEHGQMDYIPGNAGTKQVGYQSWSPVRVIGDTPVEADGSAYFRVPADTALYFQALDENRMEIVRMRAMVSLAAGETRGCRGCHESQAKAPAVAKANLATTMPLAARRGPHTPEAPPWGSNRLLGYEWLVQPILDRHCVGCHGEEDADGGLDFTAHRAADGLYQSYHTMFRRVSSEDGAAGPLVCCSDRFSGGEVSRPFQFGSRKSPLVRVLLDDPLHREQARLAPQEWNALVTWVDANAPYHDRFLNKRPARGDDVGAEFTPLLPRPFAGGPSVEFPDAVE